MSNDLSKCDGRWDVTPNSLEASYQSPSGDARELALAPVRAPDGTSVWQLPPSIGQGQIINTRLRSGLTVSVSECNFRKPYTSKIRRDTEQLLLLVPLSGSTILDNADRTAPVRLTAGNVYCYRPASLEVIRLSAAREHTSNVVVELPETGPATDITSGLCAALGWPARTSNPQVWSSAATVTIRCLAEQLHACALSGATRGLFCESKILELLVHVMRMASGPAPLSHTHNMSAENRRVFTAALLITEDLTNPPSLFELAKRVRLSHTDLNRRFRAMFGCTAFEYLRRERLRRAREMLEHGSLTLTEVAIATGFCSSSHFSRAFATEFGMSPSRYRLSVNRGAATS